MRITGVSTAQKPYESKPSRSFKTFVSDRMDNLLREEEQPSFKGVKYIDINITDQRTQGYLYSRGLQIIGFDRKISHIYRDLIDLILLVDMPLTLVVHNPQLDLAEFYYNVPMAKSHHAEWEVMTHIAIALKTVDDERKCFIALDDAHYALLRWAKLKGVTTEELLK